MQAYRITLVIAIVVASLMAFAAVNKTARNQLRTTLVPDYRKIVSIAEADLGGDGRLWKVIKVETRDSIWLEVYKMTEAGLVEIVEKMKLPFRRDGYYSFQGQAANLVIEDLNGDGKFEILSPTFTADLVGKLDIYNFEPLSNSLQVVAK